MTKGRVALTSAAAMEDGQSRRSSAIFISLGGPKAMTPPVGMTILLGNAKHRFPSKSVIPTGAYPDFLLRGPHQRPRVRLSVRESRMKLANATNLDRKSGVAQWRDLRFLSPVLTLPI